MLEERSQPTGAYIYYTTYLFRTIFLLIYYSLQATHYIHPWIFYFRNSSSQPHFATSTHNSNLRLTSVTPIHDLLFRDNPVVRPHH